MSTQTDKYKLVSPELTDPADITSTNVNWDIIETELKNLKLYYDNLTNEVAQVKENLSGLVNTFDTSMNSINNKITQTNQDFKNADTTLNDRITSETSKLQRKVTFGTDAPSGTANEGDVYIQIV